jgi:tetratricopeptide (TPR) repeat protein
VKQQVGFHLIRCWDSNPSLFLIKKKIMSFPRFCTTFAEVWTSTSMQNPVAREGVARAIEMHQRALAIYDELDDPEGRSESLQLLAKCHRILGDDEKAVELMAQSLAILQEFMQRDAPEKRGDNPAAQTNAADPCCSNNVAATDGPESFAAGSRCAFVSDF